MTRMLLASTVIASLALVGCDEAKDATKSATNAAKDAANKGAAAAKDVADAAKTKLLDGLKVEVDAIKAKIESLTKGATGVKEADRPAFDKELGEINGLMKTVTDGWEKLKSGNMADWSKVGTDLQAQAKSLMDKVTAAMTKFGIK